MEKFDAQEWKRAMAERSTPVDVHDMRNCYNRAVQRFAKNLGLLLLLINLKLPPVRDKYMSLMPKNCASTSEATVFDVCRQLCIYFGKHNDELVASSQEVGGPLKAHGFIVQMTHFLVLEKCEPSRQSMQLGVSGNHYKLLPITAAARTEIKAMLDLHDTMEAILDFGVPRDLAGWNMRANLLRKSFTRHQVAGMLSGGYSCDWCIRSLLDAMLHVSATPSLQVRESDRLSDLPGPDEGGNIGKIAAALGTELVAPTVRRLGYDASVHLLSMFACLATWSRALPKRKKRKRSSIRVDGHHIMFSGNPFQTQALYLAGTIRKHTGSRVTNASQPLHRAIYNDAVYESADMIIVRNASKNNYVHKFSANMLNGTIDVMDVEREDVLEYDGRKWQQGRDICLYSVATMDRIVERWIARHKPGAKKMRKVEEKERRSSMKAYINVMLSTVDSTRTNEARTAFEDCEHYS